VQCHSQARLYVGAGKAIASPKEAIAFPNLSLAPKSLVAAVVKPANSDTGGGLWRVGVVDSVVLACV